MKPQGEVIRKEEWEVREIPLSECQRLVAENHYSGRGANTATFRHGLFRKGENKIYGCAWWIPPTKSAAQATFPEWQSVLALSRLVVIPGTPKNAATFLLAGSIKLIRKDKRWKCLVTYADTWQGHTGTIYKASNWEYVGKTNPEATWVDRSGKMIARKAGPKTRTKAEMEALGFTMIGKFSKHKFRMLL